MHQYALGSYSKGKAHNKKRAEIAMIKNNIREMDKTKTRLQREIIKNIDKLESMIQKTNQKPLIDCTKYTQSS